MDRPIYANAMAVTSSENRMEYVLTFRHKYPLIGADGKFEKEEDEVVASVVMNRDLLLSLQDSLKEILKK